jgi:hypothetical protein
MSAPACRGRLRVATARNGADGRASRRAGAGFPRDGFRYFPTKEALQVEISGITPALVPVEALLADLATGDAEAGQRLLLLLDTFHPIVLANEEHVRTGERVYLDTWLRAHRNGDDAPVVREGRRMRWLETVLAPVDDLSPERKRLLKAALALTMGPQAIFTMKDVCRVDDDEALGILRWAATALLRAALEEDPAPVTTSYGQLSEIPIDGQPWPVGGP